MNTTKVWLGKRHFINTPPEFQRFKNVNGKLVRRNLSKDEERQELDWWNIKQSSIRRDNVYVYWYEFLKQSTKYKKVCDSEGKEGSTDLKKLYKDFGNVHIKTFRQWWRESDRGAFLFAEQSPEHKITEITHLDQLHLDEEFMNIQIPLSFSQRDIARLVYELVNKRHKGQRGKRKTEITSTAKYKVSGRVDFGRLEKTLAVYYLVKSEKNNPVLVSVSVPSNSVESNSVASNSVASNSVESNSVSKSVSVVSSDSIVLIFEFDTTLNPNDFNNFHCSDCD